VQSGKLHIIRIETIMKYSLASIFAALVLCHATQAAIEGWFPAEGGYVSIAPTNGPVEVGGVRVAAVTGTLNYGSTPAPFQSVSGSDLTRVVDLSSWGSILIDGPVTLDVQASANASLRGEYGRSDGRGLRPFPIEPGSVAPFPLIGSTPYRGGPITIAPFGDAAPVAVRGLDFTAVRGELTTGNSAAPFESISTNTPQQWSVTSSVDVLIDGPIQLDLSTSANALVNGSVSSANAEASFSVLRDPPPLDSQIVGRYSIDGGPISVQSTTPVSIRQLQLNSSGGNLIGGTNAAPFQNVVSNTDSEWAVASSVDVVLNGSVDLDVQVQPNTFVKGFTNDGVKTSSFQLYALSQEDLDAELFGIFPEEGGLLTVITTKGPIQSGAIEIIGDPGELTQGDTAAPFQFFIPSKVNPGNVTFGNLGTPTELDGPVTLGVEVSPTAVIDNARWGKGTTPTHFPIVGGLLDTGLTREPDRLEGSYSLAGGPISIRPTGEPVPLREIQLSAKSGSLNGTNNAAPFENVTTNMADVWTAQSSVDVMIDGEVMLDVEAAPFGLISGVAKDSDDIFAFALNSFTEDVVDSELIAVFPEGGGKVTVFTPDEPITTDSIEFAADIGAITAGFDPAPFDFFLNDPNNPGNIILGMNSGTVTIDGSLTLDINAAPDAQFFGTWGEGVLTTFPVVAVPNVPEPNAGVLAFVGMLVTLLTRVRRPIS